LEALLYELETVLHRHVDGEPAAQAAGGSGSGGAVREAARALLLTPEEAAGVLRIGRTAVYELMAAGALESVHVGRSRRIPVAAVEAFVARLVAEAQASQRAIPPPRPQRGGGERAVVSGRLFGGRGGAPGMAPVGGVPPTDKERPA
jgi:excisionase family DNA binding protein